jgi:hypothetical protein
MRNEFRIFASSWSSQNIRMKTRNEVTANSLTIGSFLATTTPTSHKSNLLARWSSHPDLARILRNETLDINSPNRRPRRSSISVLGKSHK